MLFLLLLMFVVQFSGNRAVSCTDCPLGQYAESEGTGGNCALAPGGYYANETGSWKVHICPSGKYAGAGSAECTPCTVGYKSSPGSTICADACQCGKFERQR